jgi:hypothetical protein
VKCLNPEIADRPDLVQRFAEEARVCTRVQHPNVVDVFDLVRDPSGIFIVMELLEGESLGAYLARGGGPPHEFISLLLGAMRGVAAAHQQGIIHRDIKPDNIFLANPAHGSARRVKVLDFGISKPMSDNARAMSQAGQIWGTFLYMSPEQLVATKDLDRRTDVYAFGVTLYEGLGRQLPYPLFEGAPALQAAQLIALHGAHSPAPLRQLAPAIPRGLEAIVARAMAKDRAERHPSVDALIAELEPFANEAAYAGPVQPVRAERSHVTRRGVEPRQLPLLPSPRESYPSLPSISPEGGELDTWNTLEAALRGELGLWSVLQPVLGSVRDWFVLGFGLVSWIVMMLFTRPSRENTHESRAHGLPARQTAPGGGAGPFELGVRLIWTTIQLAFRIAVFLFVLLFKAIHVIVSLALFAFDAVANWWTGRGPFAANAFMSSRYGRYLVGLAVVGVLIAVIAAPRSTTTTTTTTTAVAVAVAPEQTPVYVPAPIGPGRTDYVRALETNEQRPPEPEPIDVTKERVPIESVPQTWRVVMPAEASIISPIEGAAEHLQREGSRSD